jgi:TIR domain
VTIKVFLSYNSEDEHLVSQIAVGLDNAGIYTFYSAVDLRPGRDITEWVNQSLISCTHVLLFWSSNSAKSNWVKFEWQTALKDFIEGRTNAVIPVRLDDHPLPGGLSTIKFVDARQYNASVTDEILSAVAPDIEFENSKRRRLRELTGYSSASIADSGNLRKLLAQNNVPQKVRVYDFFFFKNSVEPVFLGILRSSGVYGVMPMERKGNYNGYHRITGHLEGVEDSFLRMEQMLKVHEIEIHRG